MIRPYEKHQLFPEHDLTPKERLEPAREAVRQAIRLLNRYHFVIDHAADSLTDENLQTICDAAEAALNAAENAANLGISGYNPAPVRTVGWTKRNTDTYDEARTIAEAIDRLAYLIDPYEYFNSVGTTEEDISRNVAQITLDLLRGKDEPYVEWLVEVSHDETQDPRDRERAADRAEAVIDFIRKKVTT